MPDIFTDEAINPTAQTPKPQPVTKQATAHHKVSFLSTFVRDPDGVSLAEQRDDEHILLFIRRDFITNVPWIFSTIILIILPFFLPFVFQPLNISFAFVPLTVLTILAIFYYVIIAGFVFANFVTWFYDIGIVTEARAVDIDFYNISYVSVATARAQDLKDVRYFQRGFFQSFFDYGDVSLVVEASGETLTFEQTPRPAEVVNILSALIGGHD
ncbi:MAG TPA: hypothetical protein VE090_01670 [Methylomirabilota bacterium]|nr:hypothetical protein [Methylomirabilota bacterium]